MPDRSATCTASPRSATKPDIDRFKRAMAGLDAETVPEIAVLLGYDETTIRRILKGSLQVSVSLLKVLKKHVGLDEALRICNLADKDEAA